MHILRTSKPEPKIAEIPYSAIAACAKRYTDYSAQEREAYEQYAREYLERTVKLLTLCGGIVSWKGEA